MLEDNEADRLFANEWNFPPWFQNLVRHEARKNTRMVCYFVGSYELMFLSTVQFYYNCMTWLDLDFLSYETEYCIIFMCPKKTELWSAADSSTNSF